MFKCFWKISNVKCAFCAEVLFFSLASFVLVVDLSSEAEGEHIFSQSILLFF